MEILLTLKTGFNNGEFSDISSIAIPVDNIGINRGYGAFDFFRIINKKPFYLDRHLDRFFNSINLLRLKIHYSYAEIQSLVATVIQKNNASDYYIKLFAIPLNSNVAQNLNCGFYIIPLEVDPFNNDVYVKGGSLITKEYSRFLPEAKSTNYLPLMYWYPEIEANNAVDVLYYYKSTIHETSRGNIFLIKNNSAFTPSSDILKGITRSVVIDIIKERHLSFSEEPITLNKLFEADEVFLTSTTKKILPIVKINDKTIGTGKVGAKTRELIHYFHHLQEDWGRR